MLVREAREVLATALAARDAHREEDPLPALARARPRRRGAAREPLGAAARRGRASSGASRCSERSSRSGDAADLLVALGGGLDAGEHGAQLGDEPVLVGR